MNTKMIGLVFIFFLSSFSASLKIKNHLEKEELKGKVKSVKETSYRVKQLENTIVKMEKGNSPGSYKEFNKQGNYKEIRYYETDDSFIGKYTYLYDKDDNNVQLNWSDSNGKLIQEHLYIYDKKGNANVYKMIYSDARGLYFTDSIQYDSNRNKIEEIRYHPNNIDVINKKNFKYNKEGHLVEERNWGKVKNTFQYEYNSKGTKIEQRAYENEILVSQIKYDEKENKIEENTYTSVMNDGSTSLSDITSRRINDFKKTYIYDSNGYLIETLQINKLDEIKIVRKLTTKYTYDKEGNWITKTDFTKGNPRSLIEREIIYY